MARLMTGNEAIARGAFEAGIKIGVGYPGTPSTEILENFARYPGVYAQWSPNEKVALEVGIGAALAGARTLVTMKHVGVNVAADPLLTLSYTGVNAGLVLVSADDPGMHSSQNEQDNRYYGKLAKIPVLEPSDSEEARKFVKLACELSEEFDTPVILRTTTRIAHTHTLVEEEEPQIVPLKPYQKNPQKYVMVPGNARLRHQVVEERRQKLLEYSENTPINRIEEGTGDVGFITSGISYQYVKEAFPGFPVLKLGFTWPLPEKLILKFAEKVKTIIVVEELEPYIEEHVRALGLKVVGKEIIPRTGELNHQIVKRAVLKYLGEEIVDSLEELDLPQRPPVMCPGCPHRPVFYTLSELKLTVTGDIGCYTLGVMPPFGAIDTTVCMGAGIGMALGMEKANPEFSKKTVAVIGDSTFLHSGITPLLDMVYNGGKGTILILDNRTTAMTGHQPHPATGQTLMGEPAPQVDFEALVRALGVKRVTTVDPFDLQRLKAVIAEEVAAGEVSVVVVRRECALLPNQTKEPLMIISEKCTGCQRCLKLGCPAIAFKDKKALIDPLLCNGCGVCAQICKFSAIIKGGDSLG
ncbi:indolepyruvate ferredoxin oxidoreductase subunit alpha [Carboxydothermus islandicus]|uniref:Indolepyruvate oxidoreductase subunit IorA n=1 Tax=Carboxydothermus islandicus TaxID=661089 RepID=A0A1L8D2C7_9THEO|nr:indolepyruvate ferredoxin oxidoreductase subunit alpha [Carboxydothermus islandicus]GAV25254.1 indolepyruvate ferredoxin oxidoreductase subunit alpha [Carboxydothermus islandicus]